MRWRDSNPRPVDYCSSADIRRDHSRSGGQGIVRSLSAIGSKRCIPTGIPPDGFLSCQRGIRSAALVSVPATRVKERSGGPPRVNVDTRVCRLGVGSEGSRTRSAIPWFVPCSSCRIRRVLQMWRQGVDETRCPVLCILERYARSAQRGRKPRISGVGGNSIGIRHVILSFLVSSGGHAR